MRSKTCRSRAELWELSPHPAAFLHIIDTPRLLEVLREDNRAVIRAASAASKAAEYLLGFLPKAAATVEATIAPQARGITSVSAMHPEA
jgi:antirestriction protein ArdC